MTRHSDNWNLGDQEAYRTLQTATIDELLLCSAFLFELRDKGVDFALRALKRAYGERPSSPHDSVEVVNAIIAMGVRRESDFWRNHYVATGRRLVTDLSASAQGDPPDVRRLPPRQFTVEFRRRFNFSRVAEGSALRLRLPLPVEDAHLANLTVTVDPSVATARIRFGHIEAKLVAPGSGTFDLTAQFSFEARAGLPYEGAEPPVGKWLGESESPIQITPKVRALANRLDRPGASAFDRVMAFRDHLIDTMMCGMVHLHRLAGRAPTDWVIDSGWFDCRLGAALLAALCRAKGIPSRLVGGFLLWDAPTEHYWMEAWLPDRGWTPFDLLAWDLSAGGTDARWRNVFAGALDYRMKTQIFPEIFTGAPGVPMGTAWHRVTRAIPDGTETRYIAIPDGEVIYADRVRLLKA